MSLRPPGRFASTTSSAPPIPQTTRCGEPKSDGRSSKPGPGHKQLRHTWNGTEPATRLSTCDNCDDLGKIAETAWVKGFTKRFRRNVSHPGPGRRRGLGA